MMRRIHFTPPFTVALNLLDVVWIRWFSPSSFAYRSHLIMEGYEAHSQLCCCWVDCLKLVIVETYFETRRSSIYFNMIWTYDFISFFVSGNSYILETCFQLVNIVFPEVVPIKARGLVQLGKILKQYLKRFCK